MKKQLLIGAALLTTGIAFAQNEGTDATPANYHFNQATQIPWFNNDVRQNKNEGAGIQLTGANYGTAGGGVWQSFDGAADEYYKGGLIGIVSSGGLTNADPDVLGYQNLMDGCSLVDLGGEVGQVFCWNGMGSKFIDKMSELYPEEAERWAKIPVQPGWVGGWNFNFFLDPNDIFTGASGYYRMRMIINVYAPDLDGKGVFTDIYQKNNQENNLSYVADMDKLQDDANGTYKVPAINNDICAERTASGALKEDGDGNYIWDPNRWAVVDYYFSVTGDVNGKDENGDATTPVRIKMQVNGGGAWSKYAVLIKDISFTQFDEMLTEEIYAQNKAEREYMNLSMGTFNQTGAVESIGTDLNAPVEYYNLQGVKVANPENGIYIKKQGNTTSKVVVR